MTLLSVVLRLTTIQAAIVPRNLGRAAHAWFLDRVTAVDRAYAEQLHEPNRERPFTVSDLLGAGKGKDGKVEVRPGQELALRLTSYDPGLSAMMLARLLPGLPQTLSLAHTTFQISDVVTAKGGRSWNKWAGIERYELFWQYYREGTTFAPRLTMQFASPTVFKSQDVFLPLPIPRLVFEGLARRWSAFSPYPAPDDLLSFVESNMVVQDYDLHTELVRFSRNKERRQVSGFVGRTTYAVTVRDQYWLSWVHLLSAFAFYAGVGKETTRGMGQCRVI